MATGSILSNALSALQTSQSVLNTTSNNIANINTPGYKRRVVDLEALQYGSNSAGVGIQDVRRVAATFLAREQLSVAAAAARYDAESSIHDSIQAQFGAPDQNSSLSGQIDTLFATLSGLTVDSSSTIRKQTTLSGLNALANNFSDLSSQLQSIRYDVDQQVYATTNQINEALKTIDSLNPRIQREIMTGGDPNGLKDQRDQAVLKLSELMDVRVEEQANGKLYVVTKDGVPLVTEQLYQLDYQPAGPVSASTIFNAVTIKRVDPTTGLLVAQSTNLEPHLGSGKLRGLLDMRSKTIPDLADQVGELAANTADALNAAHNASTAVPAPSALTGRNTGILATDSHGFTGKTTFVVTDTSGALVTRVDVDFGANTYSVDGGGAVAFGGTIVNDMVSAINTGLGGNGSLSFSNGVMSLSATASGTGVAIVDDATTPSSRGGRGFSHYFGMNDLFTAGAPTNYDTGLSSADANGFTPGQTFELLLRGPNGEIAVDYTHTMTAGTIGNLVTQLNTSGTGLGGYISFALDANGKLTATPSAAFSGYTIEVVDDQTTRGGTGLTLTQMFGLGEGSQADQAQNFRLTASMANNPSGLAVAKMNLSSSSVAGDVILGAGDNSGALALAAVQDQLRSFSAAGGLGAQSATLGAYAGTVLSYAATLASRADSNASENSVLKTDLGTRIAGIESVNLDEELANMMLYQKTYNAAARLITTSNELFDQLLQAVS